MNGGIQIPRRTSTPQSLKKTQIDGIKSNFKKVSDKQGQNISQINDVVVEIFRSYKNNSFKNDKNLNLLKSVFLLRNIARKNGEFIRLLSDNKEISQKTIGEQIDNMLGDNDFQKKVLEERNHLTENIKKKYSYSEVKTDICDIIQDLIDEVSKEIKTNLSKEEQQQEKQQQEQDKTSREHSNDVNQEKKLSEKQENPGGISVKDYKNSIASNVLDSVFGAVEKLFKANKQKQAEKQSISELNTDTKRKNIQIQDKISKNIENTSKGQTEKSIQRKIMNTALNQSEKVKIKGNTKKNKNIFKTSFDDIGKFSRKGLGRIHNTLLWTAVGIRRANSKGLFSLGTLWKRGGAASVGAVASFGLMMPFNIVGFLVSGVFKISKMIIGGLWKFSVGIVKAVASGISSLYKILIKPLIPYILKFLMTPQGAFISGYVTHFVYDKFTKEFGLDKDKSNKFQKNILNSAKNFIYSIKDSLKNIDVEDIMRATLVFGSTYIFPIIKKILEGMLPENLAIRGLKSLGGKALGWATHSGAIMGVVKTAATRVVTSLPAIWPFALSIGAFVMMSNEISDVLEHAKSREYETKAGLHYERSLQKFRKLKNNKKVRYSAFRDKNKNLIMQVTKSGYKSGSKDSVDVNSVLKEIVENGQFTDQQSKATEEINKFCAKQSELLDNERKSILKAPKGAVTQNLKAAREMEYEIKIEYNGKQYKTDTLPKEITNPIELRTKLLLSRIKLLEMLKNRKFSDEYRTDWEFEILKYNNAVDNLVVIKDNKGSIDENVLGEKLKLYTVDTNDRRGTSHPNTIGGFEMGKDGAYYGYRENTGPIDWQDSMQVQQTINFTMGQITQESGQNEDDGAGLYNADEFTFQINDDDLLRLTQIDNNIDEEVKKFHGHCFINISKKHFLEMCAIVSDIFCDQMSNINDKSFLSPKPPMEEFQRIMCSDRIKKIFKNNSQNYKDKYGIEKYPFDPQNTKMIQFFRLLMEQSKNFKQKFGNVVSDVVRVNIIDTPFVDTRIVSYSSKPQDNYEIFGFTSEQNVEFMLYKQPTFSKQKLDECGDRLSYQKFDGRLIPVFKSGPLYCAFATITERKECIHQKYQFVRGYLFGTKFSRNLQEDILNGMANKYLNLVMPFFVKFNEMEGQLKEVPMEDNTARGLMRQLDGTIQNLEQLIDNAGQKLFLSQEEVDGIQQKKKEYMEGIEEKMQKFRTQYNEKYKKSKNEIERHTGGNKGGKQENGTSMVERNNKSVNQAKIGARTRFSEDNSSGHMNV